MDTQTFGSTDQYKMLPFFLEKFEEMDSKSRKYVSSVIQDFNTVMKKTIIVTDPLFKNYIMDLIHNDFNKRIEKFIKPKYDIDITTYLLNYIHARIKNNKI